MRKVVKRERPKIKETLFRCLRLRCPACGKASIVQSLFQIKHHCPSCRALFKREDGYFVGAIMVNVVTTELVILLVYALCLALLVSNYEMMLVLLFVVALAFPVAFYHHSWSIWLSFDYVVESLPKHGGRGE